MKSCNGYIESVLFGVILAITLVIAINTCGDEKSDVVKKNIRTELRTNHTLPIPYPFREVVTIYSPSGSIPTSLCVVESAETFCLFTIFFLEKGPLFDHYSPQISGLLTKYYQLLFYTFISPNAP